MPVTPQTIRTSRASEAWHLEKITNFNINVTKYSISIDEDTEQAIYTASATHNCIICNDEVLWHTSNVASGTSHQVVKQRQALCVADPSKGISRGRDTNILLLNFEGGELRSV